VQRTLSSPHPTPTPKKAKILRGRSGTRQQKQRKGLHEGGVQKTVANKMLYHILSVTSTFINTNPIAIPEKGSCAWSLPKHLFAHFFGASYHQILISLPSLSKTRKSCPRLLEREGRTRQQVTN